MDGTPCVVNGEENDLIDLCKQHNIARLRSSIHVLKTYVLTGRHPVIQKTAVVLSN